MNKWLTTLILLLSLITSLIAAKPDKMQLLSPNETLKVLENVKEYAIVFGEGDNVIHTFIDPYCELSQRYLAFIFKQKERMFSKYTFYFYLYELKGKDSAEMISTILSSEYKQTMLKSVMLDHQDVATEDSIEADDAMEAIDKVAKTIGVFKRPYILINGKVK